MNYEEAFTRELNERGIPVGAADVPDQYLLDSDVARLADWLGSLDDATREAIDHVAAEYGLQAGLAHPEVAILSSIGRILRVIDTQPASVSVSASLEMMRSASLEAWRQTSPNT